MVQRAKPKIAVISDTHGKHKEFDIDVFKDIDILIHSGDATNYKDINRNNNEIIDFLEWYNNIDVKYKLFIPGNHDISLETNLINVSDYSTIIILKNDRYYISKYDISFYGFSYTPLFHNWAFMLNNKQMELAIDNIEPCDILITHGPPYGILDQVIENNQIKSVGCKYLKNKVLEIKPLYHIFGHIHPLEIDNRGLRVNTNDNITYINAACVRDTQFKYPILKPIIFNYD